MGSFLTALDAAEPEYARKWLPDDLFVMEPKWKNIFENKITANFVHRYIVCFILLWANSFLGLHHICYH